MYKNCTLSIYQQLYHHSTINQFWFLSIFFSRSHHCTRCHWWIRYYSRSHPNHFRIKTWSRSNLSRPRRRTREIFRIGWFCFYTCQFSHRRHGRRSLQIRRLGRRRRPSWSDQLQSCHGCGYTRNTRSRVSTNRIWDAWSYGRCFRHFCLRRELLCKWREESKKTNITKGVFILRNANVSY